MKCSHSLTCCQLHPPADLIHSGCTAEEEESEAADAGEDQYHGHPNEERRRFEGARRDGAKLCEAPLARQVPGDSASYAVVKEAEVAGLWRVHAIPNPVGLNKTYHVDYGEEDGEDGPQDPDGSRVPDVVGLVDLGCLRGWEHRCRCPRYHRWIQYFMDSNRFPLDSTWIRFSLDSVLNLNSASIWIESRFRFYLDSVWI